MDSIQGKMNALQSVWQTFSNSFMSSNLIKFGVDALKVILDVVEKLISTIGGFGTAGALGGLFLLFKKRSGITDFFSAIKGGVNSFKDFGTAAKIAGEGISSFLKTPAGIVTGIGAVITVVSSVISAINAYNEAQRKARQEAIDTSNTFSDAYGNFEQVYIKYSGKNVLTTDEESELKSAIDGTVDALGDKSAALREAAGASSEYIDNLDEIAKAELKEAQSVAQKARIAAEEQLIDDLAKPGIFSWKSTAADIRLPKADSESWKLIEDIVTDPDFQKYINGPSGDPISDRFITLGNGDIFKFDKNADFDGLIEQYNYATETMDRFEKAAAETRDDSLLEDETYTDAAKAVEVLSSGLDTLTQQTYAEEKAAYQLKNGIATTEESFYAMRKSILENVGASVEARDAVGQLMNKEYSGIFDLSSIESQIDYIKSVTQGIDGINNDKMNTFETFLDIKTSLNSGECSVGEYMAQMDKANKAIDSIEDKGTRDFLRVQLGLELDSEGNVDDQIKKWRDKLVKDLTKSGVADDVANKLANDLNAQELEAAVELVASGEIDLKNINIDNFRKQVEQKAKLNKALMFTISPDVEAEGIESLNAALSENVAATGLSAESMEKLESRYKSLDGYNHAKLFEETATGVRLNATELNNLEQAYANNNIENVDENLKVLTDEYNRLGEEIQNCSDINKRAELYAEQEDIRVKINELAELGAAYEGLTNAYAQWQNAEAVGNNRDMYSNVYSAMEEIGNELDLGWVDDGTKEYFDLIWGDNWSSAGKGVEDYKKQWNTLDDTIAGTTYSLEDFFKVDEDGNLKASGIDNFFDAVRQKQEELGKNWVEFDEQGNLTTIDLGVDGEKAIADALGISEELVDIFMQASKDAGFVVTIDGKYTKLADLQNKAEEAATTLKEMGKTDVDFDFDTTSVDNLKEQLTEAQRILDTFKDKNGNIKKNSNGEYVEGAQEAIDVLSTLTAMVDQLSEPTYMQLETNQVEDDLQEPLKDMQRFEELVQKKHQLNITGADTSEVDKEMREIAEEIHDNSDLKAKIGIDENASVDDIMRGLENGEYEIPATVDIELEMSEDLKDIRLLMMHQAGLISDTELKLSLELDTSAIDQYEPEQQEVIVEFFADTEDVDSYTPEQKQAIAKYIKDIDDIENWTPSDKKAVCDFIVNNEDVMSYTPEEKSAVAQYIADPSALDSFTPEQKEAVAKFIAEHGDVDSWNPEDRSAVAKFLLNNAEVEGYKPSDKYPTVKYKKDSSEPDSYQPSQKNATVTYNKDSSDVDSYDPPNFVRKVTYYAQKVGEFVGNLFSGGSKRSIVDGTANVDGTAFADGTTGKAFKKGNWGIEDSGTALMGELGPELLVRDGRYYTVGDDSAEFVKYKKGDIIFNADQTRQIFEKGKITRGRKRGKSYANGTVGSSGRAFSGGFLDEVNDAGLSVTSSGSIYERVVFEAVFDDESFQNAKEWADELNGYLEEAASSSGLANESFKTIDEHYANFEGYDQSEVFEKTAQGITLNVNAIKKLERQNLQSNISKQNKLLSDQKKRYYELSDAINKETDAQVRSKMVAEQTDLANAIAEGERYAAVLEGQASAYAQLLEAKSSTKPREPYANINDEYDTVIDLLERGWVGDEEVTSFVDLLFGDNYDTAGKRADEVLADINNRMQQNIEGTSFSIGDFLTYDENGSPTVDGYFNMLDAIMEKQDELGKNWVQKDENGNYTFDFGVNGLQEVADAFGVSKEFLELVFQSGKDAGHEVNFGGVISNLDEVEEKATNAAATLNELGITDYSFDFKTNNIDDLNNQLAIAQGTLDQFRNEDGTINMDMPGAQEALEVVSALQAKIDMLNSHYIGLKTDDSTLQEPLSKLEQYENLAAYLNQLKINPSVNAEEIAAAEQQMQEIVDYFATLDDETLAKLGFDFEGLTPEEIQAQVREKIQNGDVTIPATVDPEFEMSESLQDLVDIALLNTGRLTLDRKIELEAKFGLEPSGDIDTSAVGEKAEEAAQEEMPETVTITVGVDIDDTGEANLSNFLTILYDLDENTFNAVLKAVAEGDTETLNQILGGETLQAVLSLSGDAKVAACANALQGISKETYDAVVEMQGDGLVYAVVDALAGIDEKTFDTFINVTKDKSGDGFKYLEFLNSLSPEAYKAVINASVNDPDGGVESLQGVLSKEEYDLWMSFHDGKDGEPGVADQVNSLLTGLGVENGQLLIDAIVNSDDPAALIAAIATTVPQLRVDANVDPAGKAAIGALFDNIDKYANGKEIPLTIRTYDKNGNEFVYQETQDGRASGYFSGGNQSGDEPNSSATDNAQKTGGRSKTWDDDERETPEETTVDATAEIVDVDSSELDNQQFQVAVEASGMKEVLNDGELLRETLLDLDDESLMEIANMPSSGLASAATDAETLRNVIANMPSDALQETFSFIGLQDALTDAESFNAYLDSLTAEQRQVIIDLVMQKGSEQQETTVSVNGDTTELDAEATKTREATARLAPDVTPVTSRMAQGFKGTATLTPKLTTTAFTGTIALTGSVSGTSNANGTAFADGTTGRAFKHGNWGIKDSGTALVGELGQELVVRNGRFFTIGDNGAEFFDYKKNDIIFNAYQTKQLFEQGKITNGQTRGKAYVEGTAFVSGGGVGRPTTTTSGSRGTYTGSSSSSSKSSSSSNSNSSDASEEAEEFLEKMDWIEVAIDRVERAISRLDLKASSTFKKWTTRNEALAGQIGKVREEIDLQQRAYERYMQEANSVGLSSDYAQRVMNGLIDIETITDETLKEQIDEFQEYYEKALDCADAVEELKEQVSELYKTAFENVATEFEGYLSIIEHEKNMLEEYINQSETQAWLVSAEYYKALEKNERENLAELKEEKASLLASLNDAVANGDIKEGSEAWVEMCNSIDDVTVAIEESNTQLLEYEQTLQQLDWEVFDLIQDKISNITDEAEFLIELLSSDKLYEDKGQLTDSGMATMGLHGVNYNIEMAQADQAAKEAAKIKKQLDQDPFDQDLLNRYNEMIELQQEHIQNANDEREAIRDMVEEGIELELDALQDLIDKRNEALDTARDQYDYQKKIAEQTKEIAALEKQLGAYSGDTSEEAKATIQQLKVDLESAKEDLQESEYDKYIQDQSKLLDDLYLDYETILNERLDNLEALIIDMVALINSNSTEISSNLSAKAEEVGYTLSDSMKTIWNTNSLTTNQTITTGTNAIKDVITLYGEKFLTANTTTNSALKFISTDVASMIGQLNKLAKTNVKTAAQSSAAKPKESTAKPATPSTTTNKTSSTVDGVPKVGDKVKFINGWYYYDSQGKTPAGHQHQGQEVYITAINTRSWATHPYHISTGNKLGSGDLGWLKLNQISGYAVGKKNLFGNEIAWTQESGQEYIVRPSDGAILTPLAKGDSVLSAAASGNIWDMANSPSDFIKDNLSVGSVDSAIGNGGQINVSQNFEQLVISMPNAKNYEQLISQMQKDKNFERLIMAMTVDQIAGKSSLAKGKAIR